MFTFAASTFLEVFFLLFIFIPLVFLWVAVIFDIFRRTDLSGWMIALWLFIIIVIPFIGALIYFIIRRPTEQEKQAIEETQAEYSATKKRSTAAGVAESLEKLAGLKEKGVLTEEEFTKQKDNLLL